MSNRAFLATVPQNHCDWAVTVAFYTALHALEVLFAHDKLGTHSDHRMRDQTMRLRRYEPIETSYKVLKNASRQARYECSKQTRFRVEDVREHVMACLHKIEAFVCDNAPVPGVDPVAWPPPDKG